MLLSPSSTDGVQITCADTAGLNLDIDIVIAEWLWSELVLVEVGPVLGILDLESHKLLWSGAHFRLIGLIGLREQVEKTIGGGN